MEEYAVPPARVLELAADKLERHLKGVTLGPWYRPLKTRYRAAVVAYLPQDERPKWRDGIDPDTGKREVHGILQVPIWSDGRFAHKRGGRDLEWAALMNPDMGPPLIALLRDTAKRAYKHNDPAAQADIIGPHLLELAATILKDRQIGPRQ